MRVVIAAMMLLGLLSAAGAKDYSMTCQSPRGPYLVVYDDVAKTLIANPDSEKIRYNFAGELWLGMKAVVFTIPGHPKMYGVAAVDKDHGGMTFYNDGKFVQTDPCEFSAPVDLGL